MLEPQTRTETRFVPFEDVLTPDSDPLIPEPPLPGVVLRDVFARRASGRTVLRAPLVRAGDLDPHEEPVFGPNRTSPAKPPLSNVKSGSVRSRGLDHITWPADPSGAVGTEDPRSGGANSRDRVIDLTGPVPGGTVMSPVTGVAAPRGTRPADARWADDAFDPVPATPAAGLTEPPAPGVATETALPPIHWQPVPPGRPATVVRRCPTCDARVRVPADAERCGAGHRLSPAHAKRRWRLPGRRSGRS